LISTPISFSLFYKADLGRSSCSVLEIMCGSKASHIGKETAAYPQLGYVLK
jgi:hypothetical protein